MRIMDIVDRINDEGRCPTLQLVDRAWATNQVLDGADDDLIPAAFIALEAEDAGNNTREMGLPCLQVITSSVSVLLKARAAEREFDEFDQALDEIRSALVGYQPLWADAPLQLTGGQMIYAGAGRVVWRDNYTIRYLRT